MAVVLDVLLLTFMWSLPLLANENSDFHTIRLQQGELYVEFEVPNSGALIVGHSFVELNEVRADKKKDLLKLGFKKVPSNNDPLTKVAARLRGIHHDLTSALSNPKVSDEEYQVQSVKPIEELKIQTVSIRDEQGNSVFFGHFGGRVKQVAISANELVFTTEDDRKHSSRSLAELSKSINSEFGNKPEKKLQGGIVFDNALTLAGYSKYGMRIYVGKEQSWALQECEFQSLLLQHLMKLSLDKARKGDATHKRD